MYLKIQRIKPFLLSQCHFPPRVGRWNQSPRPDSHVLTRTHAQAHACSLIATRCWHLGYTRPDSAGWHVQQELSNFQELWLYDLILIYLLYFSIALAYMALKSVYFVACALRPSECIQEESSTWLIKIIQLTIDPYRIESFVNNGFIERNKWRCFFLD